MGTVASDQAVATPGGPGRSVELSIGGMTCASCAARVEKKLNKLDGVTATVNFATETARVSFPAAVSPDDLLLTVEQAGYTASLPPPAEPGIAGPEAAPPDNARDEQAALRQRLLVLPSARSSGGWPPGSPRVRRSRPRSRY